MFESPGRRWGFVFISLGVTLAAAGLTFWFAWGLPGTSSVNQAVLGIVVHVLFGYIVVMSGLTIYRSDLDVAECLSAAKWCAGGFGFMSLFVLWASAPDLLEGRFTLELLNELVVVGSVGAAAGVLIGLNRGQAVQNRRLVEEKEDQRGTLLFLLRLLRHDVRHDLVTIGGYADLLEGEMESDQHREYLQHIEGRTESMRQLLETADAIIESETGGRDLDSIDLAPLLREQGSLVASKAPDATVETDIDDSLYVEADDLVVELFKNLLDNAITHNPTDGLTVTVDGTTDGEEVVVTVEDDGEGIPESIRDDVFDPEVRSGSSDGDGLGLYLVRKLVDSYGGSIDVADTGDGTRFTVRFPQADPVDSGSLDPFENGNGVGSGGGDRHALDGAER